MRLQVLLALTLFLAGCATAAPAPTSPPPAVKTVLVPQTVQVTAVPAATATLVPAPNSSPPPFLLTPVLSAQLLAPGPDAIPPSFFAMNTVNATDYPKLTF